MGETSDTKVALLQRVCCLGTRSLSVVSPFGYQHFQMPYSGMTALSSKTNQECDRCHVPEARCSSDRGQAVG